MMYPRLKLAKNLLTDDGVIFISIDDNELVNLKKICDEIFGEDNFISFFIWKSKTGGAGDSSTVSIDSEYIMAYSKNINNLNLNKQEVKRSFKYKDNYFHERGSFNLRNLDESGIRYSKTLDFKIIKKNGFLYVDDKKIEFKNDFLFSDEITEDFIIVPGGEKNYLKKYTWRWSKDKIINGLNKGYLIFKRNNKGNIKLTQKTYEYFNTTDEKIVKKHFIPYRNFIDFTNTSNGTKILKDLFNDKKYFDYPKPSNLVEFFINLACNENDIVIDFFSGSGTTADAVMQYNSKKGHNVKFLLVQIPEESDETSDAFSDGYRNICEIGKERIRRAGDKIVEESGNKDLDIGFKVFKLDSSNLEKWDPDYNNLEQTLLTSQDNIKQDRTYEDLIYEIMLKYGIDLTLPIQKHEIKTNTIYSVGFGTLLICLDNNITKEIASEILKLTEDAEISRVVFKDNGFASDSDKTNIKEILKTNNIDEFITI